MSQADAHWQRLPSWQPHWQAAWLAGAADWQPQVQLAPAQSMQGQVVDSMFMTGSSDGWLQAGVGLCRAFWSPAAGLA